MQEEEFETIESKSIKGVIYESSKNISKFSKRTNKLILKILDGTSSQNLNALKENKKFVERKNK